jgi:peptidylprolyl isomerase
MTKSVWRFFGAGLLGLAVVACAPGGRVGADLETAQGFNEAAATKLESGIQYVVLARGQTGGTSPTPADEVKLHYEGRLLDGTVFDSSYARGEPVVFNLGGLIQGWVEVLQLMKPGDTWQVLIPSALAYGETGSPMGGIPPNSDLVFKIELQKVYGVQTSDTAAWAKHVPWNSDSADVKKTGSGLEYVVLASGDPAGPLIRPQDDVRVWYEGRLTSGEVFDSAYARGQAAVFPAGRLIPGWVEALQLMRPGDHWLIRVPSALGYGSAGTPGGPIPPDADLLFELAIADVHPVD